jgi:signal transduction histidine kinase
MTHQSASIALDASLDYEETLQTLGRLVVPMLADWCVIHVTIDEAGAVHRFALADGDGTNEPSLRTLGWQAPTAHGCSRSLHNVLSTGQPVLHEWLDEQPRTATGESDWHLHLLQTIGFRSVMIVPMAIAGQTLGAITLVSASSGRRFGPQELEVAEDLAHRAALAINAARLYREARDAVRGRDELLAVASHDLRTPLTAIKGRIQLLRRRASHAMPDLTSDLDQMESSADRMARLIAELIDIATVQSGRSLDLRRQATDLIGLVERLVQMFQGTTTDHSIRLEVDVPVLVGDWDGDRLDRAVGNLVANAVTYSPDGGEIVVRAYQERDGEGSWAVVSVTDHGIGIPESDVHRVFSRFFRASNVGIIGGHGIGLAGARQIVEQHGGQLKVVSQLGEGSCFSIHLPLPTDSGVYATDAG